MKRKNLPLIIITAALIAAAFALFVLPSLLEDGGLFSGKHDLSDYPEELQELYDKNPEAREFVLGYFENRNKKFDIDLSEYENCDTIPPLMQWDERWGYEMYAGNYFALSGCGPTCLSAVAIYLTGDTSLNPREVGVFSEENGYAESGDGTKWTLFSEGAEKLGIHAEELPLDEGTIARHIRNGEPVILIMGPGDFTSTGHYIVLTGITEDGAYTVHDPNSHENSEKLWYYSDISGQIRNIWAYTVKAAS